MSYMRILLIQSRVRTAAEYADDHRRWSEDKARANQLDREGRQKLSEVYDEAELMGGRTLREIYLFPESITLSEIQVLLRMAALFEDACNEAKEIEEEAGSVGVHDNPSALRRALDYVGFMARR